MGDWIVMAAVTVGKTVPTSSFKGNATGLTEGEAIIEAKFRNAVEEMAGNAGKVDWFAVESPLAVIKRTIGKAANDNRRD